MSIDVRETAQTIDTATQPGGWQPTVGEQVIAWNYTGPMVYGGRHDDPRFERMIIGRSGHRLLCEPDRVAPVDAPLPDAKDPRIQVSKGKKPHPWLSGNWCMALPKQTETWHKTKRDAVADGQRRLAIVDWHASQKTAAN